MDYEGEARSVSAMTLAQRYPCPCCGHLVFDEEPGSYDICNVCYWEDDLMQLRFLRSAWGPNHVSLIEAQKNYQAFGAMEMRFISNVRPPKADEPRELGWRMVDPEFDNIEDHSASGFDAQPPSRVPYPDDSTALYYWRPTYWRRSSS